MNHKVKILFAATGAIVAAFPMSYSLADNYSGDHYPGVDINQRVIDGQREPINKFLLKRRGGAAQKPDPGATGTINQQQPQRTKPVQ
ncbi:hypothetical protein QN219_32525 [Sinorhizobium sp. 7-81]|uniref:hypothetical protein n=1 Tax=Sinorhizobium sp. 8-89 TaxID=3049089 RepID=UPI0024C2A24D|nr:hypothetical protein [Sinorhizobium sp. 8-89]MDK1494645.1 hypothetical protein [Sinorhizobium sp. 8-89]